MRKNNVSHLSILALAVAIVALGLGAYSATAAWKLSGENFSAAVNQEINDYVEKERAKAGMPSDAPAPAAGEPVEVSVDDDAVKGDPNAPVTLIEFSDYECPFCGRHFANTLPQIMAEYVDTGKVKLVYRDFPLSFHPNARPAAIAAECAGEQGGDETYFAYHDLLFENQTKLNEELYKQLATQLGLNEGEFAECLTDPAMGQEVDADFADGQSYGVSGTPGFFINGRPLSGAQPFAAFQAIIEEELSKAE